MSAAADLAVIETNDDATYCKNSAVERGYWEDRFLMPFCPSRRKRQRRPPIIHRGYYARTQAFYLLVKQFIAKVGAGAQIVNLGAGNDTLYWRLKDEGLAFGPFVELDLHDVVVNKRAIIAGKGAPLLQAAAESGHYRLEPADLRDAVSVLATLSAAGVDSTKPTIFLSECVLCYIETASSAALLSSLADAFPEALFVNYEMVNPDDPFGKVMIRNLEKRGCPLVGLVGCPDMPSQRKRFEAAGWECGDGKLLTMNQVYAALPYDDVKRVEKLEMFDEVEEWHLINDHYCIAIAHRGPATVGLQEVTL